MQTKMQIKKLKVKQQENMREGSLCLPFQNWTKTQLTVLVNKHAERDAVGIKTIQKILDVTANEWIKPKLLLVFNYSLCHCRNYIIVSVSDFNQNLQKVIQDLWVLRALILIFQKLKKTLHIPTLNQPH